jgi:hexulose-6-phosphate isomerase
MRYKFGVMQGRLSKKINNKIQAFPEKNWKNEFPIAKKINLKLIEWTLDYKNYYKNPLLTDKGQKIIKRLKKKYSINIQSLTGDHFMQKPFWKTSNNFQLLKDFKNLIISCKNLKIKYIIIPLVDNGSLKNKKEELYFISICKKLSNFIKKNKVQIIFESDYPPLKLKNFIKKLDKRLFGINYDSGNSASLNYDVDNEFKLYGKRILNVHIKDRKKYGKTVRLGQGNANLKKLFKNLENINYKGNLILQTARSKNNKDIDEIEINLEYLKNLTKRLNV